MINHYYLIIILLLATIITLWLFDIAMVQMAHRNRWFTVLKDGGSFHGYVSHNQY